MVDKQPKPEFPCKRSYCYLIPMVDEPDCTTCELNKSVDPELLREGYEEMAKRVDIENRLLTDEEIKECSSHLSNPASVRRAIAKAQDAKTAPILKQQEQAKLERIKREIEDYLGEHYPDMLVSDWWQVCLGLRQRINISEEELREKIADWFSRQRYTALEKAEGTIGEFLDYNNADQIIALVEKSGFAKVCEDQTLPKTITNKQMAEAYGGYDFKTEDMRTVCIKEQRNMLKVVDGKAYRRVEVKE